MIGCEIFPIRPRGSLPSLLMSVLARYADWYLFLRGFQCKVIKLNDVVRVLVGIIRIGWMP